MNVALSIVICTHNPRMSSLSKVLAALQQQTLDQQEWELLLVDNLSEQVLATQIDLSWHSNARHIREEQLGLTPARLRGIKEAAAETIIFVDDDNVLAVDYLEQALRIDRNWPVLGVWGGRVLPEFEQTPPDWLPAYIGMLAVRDFDQDQWSNVMFSFPSTPCGAGLCLRKTVGLRYLELLKNDPKRSLLDRRGTQLTSGGDNDIVYTACSMGLGAGMFVALNLTHIIPSGRLQEGYLLKLAEGITYSAMILDSLWGKYPEVQPSLWKRKCLDYFELLRRRNDPRAQRFYRAYIRARDLALRELFGEAPAIKA